MTECVLKQEKIHKFQLKISYHAAEFYAVQDAMEVIPVVLGDSSKIKELLQDSFTKIKIGADPTL